MTQLRQQLIMERVAGVSKVVVQYLGVAEVHQENLAIHHPKHFQRLHPHK
jgi:hypothetical protein